jgi:hypothetical protein
MMKTTTPWPEPRRLREMALCAGLLLAPPAFAGWADGGAEPVGGTFLDSEPRPAYEASLTWMGQAAVEDAGDTAVLELAADWELAFFKNVLGGDLDIAVAAALLMFTDSTDAELPNQLGVIALDVGAIWRYVDGTSLEVRTRPGFYSDWEVISTDPFYMPFAVTITKSFDPVLSGQLGMEFRPEFERDIWPIIALGWRIHERLHLKAGLPQSRLVFYASSSIVPYIGMDWTSTTYAVQDKGDEDRDDLTVEDLRYYAGLRIALSSEASLVTEVGQSVSRDRTREAKLAVDDALYVRIGLQGPF